MAFKSNDRTFEKVYSIFDKKDYFNAKGLAKTQIGNFERALQRNDKGAQQILDKFKGDMGKAKEYINQVISDQKKQQAFEDYKALKTAVDSLQKGKPMYGAADLVKSRAHNNTQKYTMALYSALRGKKFNNYKDIHADVDSLIGESVNEARTVSKPIKVDNDTMVQIVGDNKGFRELTAALNPKTGKPIQKFGFDRGNETAKSKEELIKKLQKKYGKSIKFESVNEAKNDDKYVVIDFHKKGGGFVMTKPGSKKDAEGSARSIRKGSDISKREVLKVSDARKIRGLAGKNYLNEGKKRYYQQDRVGSAKYTISYHDGKQKHKDGSDFFGIQTFKNKKDLAKFVNTLNKSGYVYGFDESVTEDKGEVEKIKKQVGNNEIKFYDALSKVEKRLGSKYPKFLDTALKQLKQNPSKFKTNADKEEAIFQSVK